MPPPTRSNSLQKASWRGRGGPASASLLFYRRAVMTALSLVLLASFVLLIWFLWPSNREPLATSISLTDYARGSAPSVPFAEQDRTFLEAVLQRRFPGRARPLGDNADADAQHLAGVFAFGDTLFKSADKEAPLLVYVAGHGCSRTGDSRGSDTDEAFLLPVDFDPSDPQRAGLPVGDLLQAVADRKANCAVLAIDYGPIEYDLRLGTAVNRFAEVLERELGDIQLAKDQRLVVITSHRTWERSFVSPADQRSVFNHFFTAALGDENHLSEHADAICPDVPLSVKSDQRISVAELARFVQTQVSQWVWHNTDFVRTQRPLVLVKAGGEKPVRLEFTQPSEQMPADALRLAAELQKVLLCRVEAAKAEAATKESDKAAPADEAKKPTALRLPAPGGLLAATMLAQAPTTESAPTPGAPAPTEPPAAPPPVATPPAAPAEDTRPEWLKAQSRQLPPLLAIDSTAWSAADFDLQLVRERTAALLDVQQRTLAGLAPLRSGESGTSRSLSPSARHGQWNPPAGVDPAPWIAAVKARNAVLLQIAPLADAVAQIEGPARSTLRNKLSAVVEALQSLVQLTDRNALIESRASTPTVLYQAVSPTDEQCDVTLLASVQEKLSAAHRELLSDLRTALRGAAQPAPLDWLNAWELAQSLPLTWLDAKPASGQPVDPLAAPHWTAPRLAVAPPAATGKPAAAARAPKPGVTPDSAERDVQDRRRQWLLSRARLANLLDPAQPAIDLAALNPGPAINDRQLNQVALSVKNACDAAVKRWSGFDAAAAMTAAEHWQADLAGRLALVVPPRLDAPPAPATRLQAQPTQVRLGLLGPRVGSSEGEIERAVVLDQAAPTHVSWQVQRENPALLASVMLEITFEPADLKVLDARGNPVTPSEAGRPLLRLLDYLDADRTTLTFQVTAQRQVQAQEAASAERNRKELAITLRLAGQSIGSAAAFRLPDSRYLDVLVSGHKATLERDAPIALETEPEGWQWRQVRLDEVARSGRGSEGDYRVEVSPFPRGQTHFGLRLVNRAAKSRKLKATWYVAPQGPQALWTWRQWQNVIDDPLVAAIAVPPQELAAGQSWQPPLFLPPMPPAAGAAPPAAATPPPAILNVENGLLLVLADELDPAWQQRVWLRPRPLHPAQYLDLLAQFRPAPPRDAVVVSINAKDAIRTQLPPGPMPVEWFPASDERISPPPPAPRDFSLPDAKPITADLVPDSSLTGTSPLRAVLGIDGYPRAAHFPAVPRLGQPTQHVRLPYVQLQFFEESPAPAAAPGAPPGPPVRRALARSTFTSRVPALSYQVFADFGDRAGQSLRLVHNDNVGSALARWVEDRQYLVQARKPPDPAGPQLAMDCQVLEWSGSLGASVNWLEEGRNVLRAQIVRQVAGQEQPLGGPGCQDEFVIVLDRREPRITTDMPSPIDYLIGQKPVRISFTVFDGESDKPQDASGVAAAQVLWSTDVKEDRLVSPRTITSLLEPDELRPPKGGQQDFACALPPDVTKEPGQVSIWVQATDRAGNVSRAIKLCDITIRKPRMLDKLPGGGKAAKGK